MIAITEAGETLLEEENERRVAWLTQCMERLSADERKRIADAIPILQRLGDSATRSNGAQRSAARLTERKCPTSD